MAEYVVAYGKLRRGLQYHQQFHAGSTFHGTEHIQGFKMFENLEENYPFVVRSEGSIVGEIFAVSPQQLEDIDAFSKVPSEFVREKISVGEFQVWIYVYSKERNPAAVEIPNGDWTVYESSS